MIRSVITCLTIALGLASAQAQEVELQPAWELEAYVATEQCLNGEGPQAAKAPECRDIIFAACPGNAGTTVDMMMCSDSELRFWDGRLNAAYKDLRALYKAEDDLAPDSPYQLAVLLRDAQRAWIGFRDAECKGLERNRYRGGSMGRLTSMGCLVDMTADRAQALENSLGEARM